MYVPTKDELKSSITDKVIDSFAELVFVAPENSYELHSAFRLVNSFDRMDKTNYGALKNFVNYCNNTVRYYRDEKSTVLLKQVITDVNKFVDDNYYFLN